MGNDEYYYEYGKHMVLESYVYKNGVKLSDKDVVELLNQLTKENKILLKQCETHGVFVPFKKYLE